MIMVHEKMHGPGDSSKVPKLYPQTFGLVTFTTFETKLAELPGGQFSQFPLAKVGQKKQAT